MLVNNDERFVVPGVGNFVEDLVAEQCIEIPVVTLPLTIGNARIDTVGKYQSCMVSKLRIIWKQALGCWRATARLLA